MPDAPSKPAASTNGASANAQSSEGFVLPFDPVAGRHRTRPERPARVRLEKLLKKLGGAWDGVPIKRADFADTEGLLAFRPLGPDGDDLLVEVWITEEAYDRPHLYRDLDRGLPFQVKVYPDTEAAGANAPPPVTLKSRMRCEEVSYTYELVEPGESQLPLAADPTLQYELKLRFSYGRNGGPAKDVPVELEIPELQDRYTGTLAQARVPTDESGAASFAYTPPDLFYQPGRKLRERMRAYSVAPNKRALEDLELPLAPKIELSMQGLKKVDLGRVDTTGYQSLSFGLSLREDEPLTVIMSAQTVAQQRVVAIEGHVRLACTGAAASTAPAAMGSGELDVNDMELETHVYDYNGRYKVLSESPKTGPDGKFRWKLEELADIMQGRATTEHDITDELGLAQLTTDTSKELHDYETRLREYCPLGMLEADTQSKLLQYGEQLQRQLAGRPKTDLPKAFAALLVLTAGACGIKPWHSAFAQLYLRAQDGLGSAVSCIVQAAWNFASAASFVRKVFAGLTQFPVLPKSRIWARLTWALNRVNQWLGVSTAALSDPQAVATTLSTAGRSYLSRGREWLVELIGNAAKRTSRWAYQRMPKDLAEGLFSSARQRERAASFFVRLSRALGCEIPDTTGHQFGVDKTIDCFAGLLIDYVTRWFTGVPSKGAAKPPAFSLPYTMRYLIRLQMSDLLEDAAHLNVPEDPARGIKTYNELTLTMTSERFALSDRDYDVYCYTEWGEWALLGLEILMVLVALFLAPATWGFSVAKACAIMPYMEVTWYSLKGFVRGILPMYQYVANYMYYSAGYWLAMQALY